MDTLGRQPVNQCTKISHCQDHAGFMPRAIRNSQGPRRPPNTLCNCTGELCVHPVHQFTKLRTCPLTKSGGFPTPYPPNNLRVPGGFRLVRRHSAGHHTRQACWQPSVRTSRWQHLHLSANNSSRFPTPISQRFRGPLLREILSLEGHTSGGAGHIPS